MWKVIPIGSFTIEVRGADKLITKFENMSRKMTKEVKQSVKKHTHDMEAKAKHNATYKTGHLERSIHSDFFNGGLSGEVSTNLFYAPMIEYGTAPHKITAKGGALKFKIGGNTIFRKSVMHPGTRAQPFMFPAFLVTRSAFTRDLHRIMREVVD